jgi:hypothetical protein
VSRLVAAALTVLIFVAAPAKGCEDGHGSHGDRGVPPYKEHGVVWEKPPPGGAFREEYALVIALDPDEVRRVRVPVIEYQWRQCERGQHFPECAASR